MQNQHGIDNRPSLVPIDTLVYLGAGSGEQLDAYLAYDVQRALLVEADPEQIETLKARSAQLPRAEVICAAVGGAARSAVLYRYNLPGAASLRQASGLRQLFPGLREVDRLSVETVDPAELLSPLQLASGQNNMLVIDLPGEEMPVLDTLRRSGNLHCFGQLKLHCGRQSLYEGSEPAARILVWLREEGFDVLDEDDSQNPDRPCWTLQRNALQIQNRELEQQLEQLKADLAARECEAAETRELFVEQQRQTLHWQQDAVRLSAERDDLARQREEQFRRANHLDQERESLEGMASELCSQLAEQQQQTGHWTLKSESLTAALEAQQLHWRLEVETLNAALLEHRQQIEQLVQTRDAQTQLVEELQMRIEGLAQSLDNSALLAGEQLREIEQLKADRVAIEGAAANTQELFVEQQRQTVHWLQEAEGLKTELEARQQQLEACEKACEEQARQTAACVSQINELTQAREKAELLVSIADQRAAGQVMRANDKVENLQKQLGESNQRASQLAQECEAQVAILDELRPQLADQQRQTMYWLHETERLKADRVAMESSAADTLELLVEQRRQTTYWIEDAARLSAERDELARQREEQSRRANTLAQERDSLESMASELCSQLAEQQQQTMHWRQQVEQLEQARDAQAQLAKELQLRLEELAQTLDNSALTAGEQRQEIAQLVAERDQQVQRADQLARESQAQEIATAELRELLAEQQRQTAHWLQEVQSHKEAAEARTSKDAVEARQIQIDQMTQAKDESAELIEQRRQTEHWFLEVDKLKHTLEEEKKRGDELERQFREKQHRQTLLDEELLKAEAQIDLISDILIREKSF